MLGRVVRIGGRVLICEKGVLWEEMIVLGGGIVIEEGMHGINLCGGMAELEDRVS
jgi:hypothetical protein